MILAQASETATKAAETWIGLAREQGVATAFSAAILAFLGFVLIIVLRWAAPRADKVLNAHLTLVETATTEMKEQTVNQIVIRDSIRSIGQAVNSNEERQQERHQQLITKLDDGTKGTP